MLNNQAIQAKIRHFGKLCGLGMDAAICERCGFNNRAVLGKIGLLKTSPQLDTLHKFAKGLGVCIEDLIYDRSDADMTLGRLLSDLSEYEKMEVVAYIRLMNREKNSFVQPKAA